MDDSRHPMTPSPARPATPPGSPFALFAGLRILLTGHTGFKGTWLAIWLRELGAEVFGYALPPDGPSSHFTTTGLASLIHHRVGDIRDQSALEGWCQSVRPDLVLHLAAQSLVLRSYQDPIETFGTNVMGTAHLLEAVRATPTVRAVVVVTSDKCYSTAAGLQAFRESDPMGGDDPYSASKGCAELVAHCYQRTLLQEPGIALATARAGNVLGAGDWSADRIVPDYFRARERGGELVLRHPGAIRPWQHVLEPLHGYLTLAATLLSDPGRASGAWNFGPADPRRRTVGELVSALQRADPGQAVQVRTAGEAGPPETDFLALDVSRTANRLGWWPVLDFDRTIRMVVDGYLADRVDHPLEVRRRQIGDYLRSRGEG